MRSIKVHRKKSFFGCAETVSLVVDGQVVERIKYGGTAVVEVSDDCHEIYIQSTLTAGNEVILAAGNENAEFEFKYDVSKKCYFLVALNAKFQEQRAEQGLDEFDNPVPPDGQPSRSMMPCFVSTGIITMLLILLGVCMYVIGEASLQGFVVGLILAMAFCASMLIGGFWLVLIPLPYFFIWRTGCVKPNLPTKQKVVLAILSYAFPILSIVFMNLL